MSAMSLARAFRSSSAARRSASASAFSRALDSRLNAANASLLCAITRVDAFVRNSANLVE